jgi:hypothetical protein
VLRLFCAKNQHKSHENSQAHEQHDEIAACATRSFFLRSQPMQSDYLRTVVDAFYRLWKLKLAPWF